MKRVISTVLVIFLMFGTFGLNSIAKENETKIKNIIYMIPDGGGTVPFQLANYVNEQGGLYGNEKYPNVSQTVPGSLKILDYVVAGVTTYSANAEITDSAAAGTTLSSGYKTNQGYLGLDTDKKPHASILEVCKGLGKKTGMVTTYDWSNATPAAFSAHDISRSNNAMLSEQTVNKGLDVVLGIGFGASGWGSIKEAEVRGYNIINNKSDLANVKKGDRIWGNLESREFPYDVDNKETTATLAEMTRAAITALADADEDGFFLMVEGSHIDGAGHENGTISSVGEILAYESAFEEALKFAKGRDDTIVVSVADHDTGGMELPEDTTELVKKIQNRETITEEDITWTSKNHTGRNVALSIYAPEGVELPEGINPDAKDPFNDNIIDNTEIAPYLLSLIGGDFESETEKLFVDVTDMGTYDTIYEFFKFNDSGATIKRNAAYAFFGGEVVDLDGQTSVYVGDRFYVPQKLLNILNGKEEAVPMSLNIPVIDAEAFLQLDSLGETSLKFNIKNLINEQISGYMEFTYPEDLKDLGKIDFGTVEALGKTTFNVDGDYNKDGFNCSYKITLDDGRQYDFGSSIAGGNGDAGSKVVGFLYAKPKSSEIKIDGVLDDQSWQEAKTTVCDQVDMLVDMENWKGYRDLSGSFAMTYDEKYFYLGITVTDEVFTVPVASGGSISKSDCVMFGIYDDSEGLFDQKNAGSCFDKFHLGFTEGGPMVHRQFPGPGKGDRGVIEQCEDCQMGCTHDGDITTYELKISWNKMFNYDYTPEPGKNLAFGILFLDNDGDGVRGWMEYGSAVNTEYNVNKFAKLYMLGDGEESTDLKVYYNDKKITFNHKPFIFNDRTMVSADEFMAHTGLQKEITVGQFMGDTAVQVVDDIVYVPVRALCEEFGAIVDWKDETRTVIINK